METLIFKYMKLGNILAIPRKDDRWKDVYNYHYNVGRSVHIHELYANKDFIYPYESDISSRMPSDKWQGEFDFNLVVNILKNDLNSTHKHVLVCYRNAYLITIITSNKPIPILEEI